MIAYTTRATEKLRQQRSLASGIQVYIRTNPHRERDPQYQQTILMPLPEPTDDTRLFCHAALHGLRRIYRSGYAYQKAGIMLTGIIPASSRPHTLFDDVPGPAKIACTDDDTGSHQPQHGQRNDKTPGRRDRQALGDAQR